MFRHRLVWSLLAGGLLFGVAFLVVLIETAGPKLCTGASVTPQGYSALIASFLGFFGLTTSGVITAVLQRLGKLHGVALPGSSTDVEKEASEIVELTVSFAAAMRDRSNLAYQRRFLFALVDAISHFKGLKATHDGGVIQITYSGFADPPSQPA